MHWHLSGFLSLLVQTFESAIQQINLYLAVKYQGNKKLHYPLDKDLSNEKHYPPFEQLGQKNFNSW